MIADASPPPGLARSRGAEAASAGPAPLGLRERKRRALRHKLSDTATLMFLEHGFDNVRVSDVAQACGVSTKTVWNHFPTKEALLFDRGETLATVLRAAAEEPTDVLAGVLSCIREEVDRLDETGPAGTVTGDHDVTRMVRAFAMLCEGNSALRAATADRLEGLTQLAAQAVAQQTGTSASSPESQIVASALISLWRVHLSALLRLSEEERPLTDLRRAVLADVEAGAAVVARIVGSSSDHSMSI